MRANLEAISRCVPPRQSARVLLVGMRLPPNYGLPYAEKFQRRLRARSPRSRKLPLVPFCSMASPTTAIYFQPDGIHPTAAAQPIMLDTVWKGLRPLLKATVIDKR